MAALRVSAKWWGQKAPSTTRCIKTRPGPLRSHRQRLVRKHPAPQGALRRVDGDECLGAHGQKAPNTTRRIKTHPAHAGIDPVYHPKAPSTRRCIKTMPHQSERRSSRRQKAPSTRRCIKTSLIWRPSMRFWGQKAPSTTRCIKTCRPGGRTARRSVRKHPAPQGALRHELVDAGLNSLVRKHPAPEGALRPTQGLDPLDVLLVRKQPAPQGALRLCFMGATGTMLWSESTQHHKVH